MLTIIYDAEYGRSVNDGMVEHFVKSYLSSSFENERVYVGSSVLLTRFRLAMHRGEIAKEDITFMFKGEVIDFYDLSKPWPEGLADMEEKMFEELFNCIM